MDSLELPQSEDTYSFLWEGKGWENPDNREKQAHLQVCSTGFWVEATGEFKDGRAKSERVLHCWLHSSGSLLCLACVSPFPPWRQAIWSCECILRSYMDCVSQLLGISKVGSSSETNQPSTQRMKFWLPNPFPQRNSQASLAPGAKVNSLSYAPSSSSGLVGNTWALAMVCIPLGVRFS